jgi:membrane-bound lytic murein transglycosylase B
VRSVKLVIGLPAVLCVALAATGCGGQSGKQDCASVAADVSGQVAQLRTAAAKTGQSPRDAATALRKIQQDIDVIAGNRANSAATTKALADLSTAVDSVKDELDKSEPVDIKPVVNAAAALTSSCRKG